MTLKRKRGLFLFHRAEPPCFKSAIPRLCTGYPEGRGQRRFLKSSPTKVGACSFEARGFSPVISPVKRKRRGFTLIELLVVISIIALLAAVLLPVFFSVRAKGRQAACVSNLHQLGLAAALYSQDSDDGFPYGGDPTDLQTDAWQTAANGQFWPEAHNMPRLQDVLAPYVSAPDIWHCPADTGFDVAAFTSGDLSASPSEFAEYGMSYAYRTELPLRGKSLSTVAAFENYPPYTQHGPSDINLLCDQSDYWHGTVDAGRVNMLMIDGHVKGVTYGQAQQAWHLVLDLPAPNP